MTAARETPFAYCAHCGRKVAVSDGQMREHRVYGSADTWYCPGASPSCPSTRTRRTP